MIRWGLRVAALTLPLLASCVAQPLPAELYYRIDPVPTSARLSSDAPIVLVEPFDAFGIYAERALIFRRPEAGGALEQYRHQFWAEAPALMLSDGLRRSLRTALGDAKVQPRNSRQRAAFIIRPRLRQLEQVIDGDHAQARFAVDFLVTDESNQPRFVLAFEDSLATSDASPGTFAAAVSQLATKANAALVERLALALEPN